MLQYIVILLDDTSASFCHYDVTIHKRHSISLEYLRRGIRFAMKQGLNIQFVYPDYEISEELQREIGSVEHYDIKPSSLADETTDVVVVDEWDYERAIDLHKPVTIRLKKKSFLDNPLKILPLLHAVPNINVVIRDIDKFNPEDYDNYKLALGQISEELKKMFVNGEKPQISILTDRMVLPSMNNCNAGDTTITLAPDGNFYVCPAFYYESPKENCGNINDGLYIKNQLLYKIDYAPICRHCDAYQCKRCVWLNKKTTHEVNTPSEEQCKTAHMERNASRSLLYAIREHGDFLPDKEITEIDYLDPFEKRNEW